MFSRIKSGSMIIETVLQVFIRGSLFSAHGTPEVAFIVMIIRLLSTIMQYLHC